MGMIAEKTKLRIGNASSKDIYILLTLQLKWQTHIRSYLLLRMTKSTTVANIIPDKIKLFGKSQWTYL